MGLYNSEKACYWKIFVLLLSLGGLAMLISSFIFAIRARNEVRDLESSMSSFVDNWKTDMVFDLTFTANPPLPSADYYVTEWKSRWPGNDEGCWCTDAEPMLGKCDRNQGKAGCKTVPASGPQDLKKWTDSQVLFAIRGAKTSFKQNYLNINPDGSCKSGFKNCGDKDSKSRGLCIPVAFANCPITDISSVSVPGFKSLALAGMTIYMGYPTNKNPISDLMYVQDHACFIRSHYARAPGRSKYPFLKGDQDNCIKDPSVTYLSSMGESTFLDLNAVNYTKLAGYGSSNNYQYRMTAGRYINWSPDCSDTVESLSNKSTDLESAATQHQVLFALYIISLIIAGITFLVNYLLTISAMCIGEQKYGHIFKYTFIARLFAWILVVPSIIICLIRVRQLYTYYREIGQLGCSDPDSNNIFSQTAEKINYNILQKHSIVIALSFVGALLESVTCWLFLKVHVPPKNAEQAVQPFPISGEVKDQAGLAIPGSTSAPGNPEQAALKENPESGKPLAKPEGSTSAAQPI